MFTDQEIIDIAGIRNYPNSIKNNFYVIENDDFYVRCDLRDSTQQAVLEKATELYPQTFDAVKKN